MLNAVVVVIIICAIAEFGGQLKILLILEVIFTRYTIIKINLHMYMYIVNFVQKVDSLSADMTVCQQKLAAEANDQMNILRGIELPTEGEEVQPCVDSINSKYHDVIR